MAAGDEGEYFLYKCQRHICIKNTEAVEARTYAEESCLEPSPKNYRNLFLLS